MSNSVVRWSGQPVPWLQSGQHSRNYLHNLQNIINAKTKILCQRKE